jgi:sigma-E factor negative regulatory protein RseA
MADQEPTDRDSDRAALSSMADGEAGSSMQERCLALWAGDAHARARWRDYQLIGDVLRSRELARESEHDAEFLSSLRARLAREPVLLRPAGVAAAAPVRRTRAWAVPMAALAGVTAVAGVVMVLRTSAPQGVVPSVLATGGGAALPVATASPNTLTPLPQAVSGRLIRDARLERYFAAHRQSANGAALQMPGAVVRSVDTIVLEDR